MNKTRKSLAPRWWMLVLGAAALFIVWFFWLDNSTLFKTSLNTSFNRFSSTEVKLSIPTPGLLTISAGPSTLLTGATVFAITLDLGVSTATDLVPFTVDPAVFTTIVNAPNPTEPKEIMLAVSFLEGAFTGTNLVIAKLPFSTPLAGQFEVKSVYFGSLPTAYFPPFQDYPIFIESSNFLYDEKGAAKLLVTPPTTPPPTTTGVCNDGVDNDSDGKIDYPTDPGCVDALDNDETDTEITAPVRLDLPSQFIRTVQTPDLRTETILILAGKQGAAQEQLQYEFAMKASGGAGTYTFGVHGRSPNTNGVFLLQNSGLVLSPSGVLTGAPDSLVAGNYRYPLYVTDGKQTFNFTLQIAVHDAFGDAIGLDIETNFTGEHRCTVNQVCEAFFRASNGIEPYIYGFSGERPPGLKTLLQVNAGQAFYRFVPTLDQVGSYQITVSVRDSSKRSGSAAGSPVLSKIATVNPAPSTTDGDGDSDTGTDIGDTPVEAITSSQTEAAISFTLVISAPEVTGTFKFAADCNFLDLSDVEPAFKYFQFTCQHGVIEGSEGLVRAEDFLNRAEAAKVTTLIFSDEGDVVKTFKPFQTVPNGTPVNYQDVSVGDWYASFVYYLFKQGVIVDNTLYRPSDTLNSAEAMKLVIEAYAALNDDLIRDLLDITDYNEWYQPYQTIASYVDASVAYIDPGTPATREQIAELLFKLNTVYPVKKFQ